MTTAGSSRSTRRFSEWPHLSFPIQERIVAKAAEREANQGSEETRAEIVRLLLRKKADANAKSQCGSTPLYLASRDGV